MGVTAEAEVILNAFFCRFVGGWPLLLVAWSLNRKSNADGLSSTPPPPGWRIVPESRLRQGWGLLRFEGGECARGGSGRWVLRLKLAWWSG